MAEFKITGTKKGVGFAKEVVEQAIVKLGELKKAGDKKVVKEPRKTTPGFLQRDPEPKFLQREQETIANIGKKQTDDLDYKIKISNAQAGKTLDEIYKLKSQGATKNVLDDFNIDKISDRGDFLLYIDQISKKYFKQFEKTTGGVRSKKELLEVADILQQDPDKFVSAFLNLKPGSTLNDAQIFAAREILIAGNKKLDILADAAVNGGPDALLAFKQHLAMMAEFQRVLKGIQTETARALNQFRYKTREGQGFNASLDEINKLSLLDNLGGEEQARAIAQQYRNLGALKKVESVEATRGFLTATSESIGEIFLNVILSNPISHLKNTAGNFLTRGILNLERNIASNISRMTGKLDGVAPYEDIAAAYGAQQAREAIWAAIGRQVNEPGSNLFQKIKNLKNVELENYVGGEKFDINQAGKFTSKNFGFQNNVVNQGIDIAGQLLTLGRIPTKLLSVSDNYFKNIAFLEEIYAQAYRKTFQLIESGLVKADVDSAATKMAQLIHNPSDDMSKAAVEHAKLSTFQTKLKNKNDLISDVGNLIIYTKSKTPFLDPITNYYLPFVQTPTNILTFALERMPVGNLFLRSFRADLAAGGARADKAIAKMALGTFFYSTFATWGYYGISSGTNPTLAVKGKTLTQDTLNLKNKSFVIDTADGIKQFSYAGLDPISMMITLASDMGHVAQRIDFSDPDKRNNYLLAAAELTLAIGENLTDASYMAGVGKFMDDWQRLEGVNYNFKKFLGKWSENYAASFIPTGIRTGSPLNWSGDDYKKIALEFDEYVQKYVYDVNLAPAYDLFGEQILKSTNIPFASRDLKLSPLHAELFRVNPDITPIKRSYKTKVGGIYDVTVPYTSEELSFLQRKSGEYFKDSFGKLLTENTEYNKQDRPDSLAYQKAMILDVLEKSRSSAVKDLLSTPEIIESFKSRIAEQADKAAFDKNEGQVLPDGYFLEQFNQQ